MPALAIDSAPALQQMLSVNLEWASVATEPDHRDMVALCMLGMSASDSRRRRPCAATICENVFLSKAVLAMSRVEEVDTMTLGPSLSSNCDPSTVIAESSSTTTEALLMLVPGCAM